MIPGKGPRHPTVRKSFHYARQGLRSAFASERNIKIISVIGILAILAGLIIGLDLIEWAIVLLCCGAVVTAELLNTAIEKVVDLVSPEFHPLAGQAKDIAAAAVWVLCVQVAIVGLIVFVHALFFA